MDLRVLATAFFGQYILLFKNHARFLGFGFLVAFASSAGQTYFIGVFGPQIQLVFNLSHTEWGSYYLFGTLASAVILLWTGRYLDSVDLRKYVTIVLASLAISCLIFSQTYSSFMLVLGVFLLRQTGQGLASHTAITSISRYLDDNRGKGIAIASMGFSMGEALLPFLAVLSIAMFGWRETYLLVALCLVFILPLALWSLKGFAARYEKRAVGSDAGVGQESPDQIRVHQTGIHSATGVKSLTQRQMFAERRFYLLLPAIIIPSVIMTGLFFHHLTLAEMKHWSAAWVTGNYWIYAISSITTLFLAGPLIDRFTATRIVPIYLVPLILALSLLIPAQNPLWVIPYMGLIGMTSGLHFAGLSALWAELYGTVYLGGIKSVIGSISVFASALGPVFIGIMVDLRFSFSYICSVFIGLCVLATLMLILGLRQR